MSRAKKYKYEKGDKIGLYEIIRPLPSEANVKNLILYCRCLLCDKKVKRYANRLASKHRGCSAEVKVETPKPDPEVVHPLLHTKADGTQVQTNRFGFEYKKPSDDDASKLVAEATADAEPEQTSLDDEGEDVDLVADLNLPPEVAEALNIDVDAQAIEIIRLAKDLDPSTNYIFINTFKRYLTLVHLARRLEKKIGGNTELTVIGSTGTQVANPLIVQYKQVSAESNAVIKVLLGIVAKMNASKMDDDPLLKALAGGD